MTKKTALILSALAPIVLILILMAPELNRPRLIEIKNNPAPAPVVMINQSQEGFFLDKDSISKTNFLILGAAGEGNDAPDLTDTILVVHFVPAEKKIYLFSLPRDLLVKIPGGTSFSKLNALYAINKNDLGREFDMIKQKVQAITGLTINHYIFVDLTAVKNLVDILGGINILVKKDILDTAFPGPNHTYQTFAIKAGWRYLDDATALKYIRSRHSAGGDFDRINRQQDVLQALKQKVLTLNFWNVSTLFKIYDTLASHIKTDLGWWQINDWWQEIKSIPGENIIKNEFNNTNFLESGEMVLGDETASILKPKAGLENYEEIRKYIKETIKN
ncbi:MAG: cell envelope-related transcriptional attenuator [Parcubacteria group bacterium LiPW_39]|nr:MAG: cell envelope-related transcriptional attenuator [Parcubacteria group bacterium LiPW_39]